MPAAYELTFQPEGRVELFFGSRGNYYEFPDGSRLDVHTTPAWCRRCGGFTHGERIESLEEIDRQLADLRDPRSELYRLLAHDYLDEHKNLGKAFTRRHSAERERRRQWRADRKSPPRCIACGADDVFVLPMNQPVPNPAGPGTVELQCIGMCSTSFNEWFFTPEGERIPRDTHPTYWHHPALDNSPDAVQRFLAGRLGNQAVKRGGEDAR